MFELKPTNKWVIIDPVKEDERVGKEGIIIAPGNALQKQHRLAKIVAKDDCEEAKKFEVGDLVLYDVIGSVDVRIGNQMFTTVKALNVMSVVKEKVVHKYVQVPDPKPDPLAQAIVETHG